MLHEAQGAVEEGEELRRRQAEELELRATLIKEKQRVKKIWREKCEQQLLHEEVVYRKDTEIARLKARLLAMAPSPSISTFPGSSVHVVEEEPDRPSLSR